MPSPSARRVNVIDADAVSSPHYSHRRGNPGLASHAARALPDRAWTHERYGWRQPSIRAGRNRSDATRANAAPTVIPISLSGMETSQTMGQITKASSAKGQHSTKRMNQPTRNRSVFTGSRPMGDDVDDFQLSHDRGVTSTCSEPLMSGSIKSPEQG